MISCWGGRAGQGIGEISEPDDEAGSTGQGEPRPSLEIAVALRGSQGECV